MGQDARLVVYTSDESDAKSACKAAFERLAQLDQMMSDYKPDSELMRLSDKAGGPPVKVSPELYLVLKRAQEISRLTAGEFDVTVGPEVALWRKARKTGMLPTDAEIAAARRLVGWRKVKLDEKAQTVKLAVPGMRLDLGGIAKGYSADEAQKVLKRFGVTRAMVDIGDIVLSDAPPEAKGWTVQIPDSGLPDQMLSNCAISSSGDTEQYVVIGGKRFSHVVEPHSGRALTSRVQATVIAREGLTSDPLSTSMTLVGAKTRARLLRRFPGTKAYVRKL
jgi:thiamine biosynthesis lipoprotein